MGSVYRPGSFPYTENYSLKVKVIEYSNIEHVQLFEKYLQCPKDCGIMIVETHECQN